MTVENPDKKEQKYLDILDETGPPEDAILRREEFGYDRETCLMYGRYMLDAARKAYTRKQRLTEVLVTLANRHGYGPSSEVIRRNFDGALWRFNYELGSVHGLYGFARGRFDDWSEDDFIDYGNDIILHHGLDKPKADVFEKMAKNGHGPSTLLLAEPYGGLGKYFERLGFVNPKSWDRADYLNWAADVAASGMGLPLTAQTAGLLSKHRRGPSARSIITNYGSLLDLREDAERKAASYDDGQREAASRRFGVLQLGFLNEDKGQIVDAAFSTVLRVIVVDGKYFKITDKGAVLFDLLLRHIDSPVYKEDFFEEYQGKNRARGDEAAYGELSQIPALAPHVMRLEYDGNTAYGLSSRSHDISLLTDRTVAVANYNPTAGRGDDETARHHTKVIAMSAAGAAVAAATLLVIKRRHKP